MDDPIEWKKLLGSSKKLERERGVELLRNVYVAADDSERTSVEGYILNALRSTEIRWEETQGALLAAKMIVTPNSQNENATQCAKSDSKFVSELKLNVVTLLEHPEYAVRLTAGEYQHR